MVSGQLPVRLDASQCMEFALLMKLVTLALVLSLATEQLLAAKVNDQTGASGLNRVARDSNYIDVSDIPNVDVQLRYASENNFLKRNLYGDFHRCLLQRLAAAKLRSAAASLEEIRPSWKLLIFDCLRPRSLQEKLYAAVKGTDRQPYVANPRTGSIHNYGLAVDLSLEDGQGHEIDMGTPFDDFTPLAQPAREQENLEAGRLSQGQLQNRRLLREVMTQAGFIQLPIEWWHYDALPKDEVRKNFKIVE